MEEPEAETTRSNMESNKGSRYIGTGPPQMRMNFTRSGKGRVQFTRP